MELSRTNTNYKVITFFLTIYPFLLFPWNIYYSTFTKIIYLTIYCIFLWLIFLLKWGKDRAPLFSLKTRGEKLVILFFLFMVISTIFAKDSSLSFLGNSEKRQGLIAWTNYITIFLFSYHFIPIQKQKNTVKYMFFASFFCAIYGIIQHFFLDVLIGKEVERGFVPNWGFFDNQNHFGTYLTLMMLLGMTLYLMAKNIQKSLLYWGVLCTLFISVLYTMTRGAWIAILFGIIFLSVFVVWKRKALWKKWIVLLASMFIVLLIVNFTEHNIFFNRVLSLGNDIELVVSEEDNGEAGSGRWRIWKRALPVVKENYLIGTGLNSFPIAYPLTEYEKIHRIDNSHNEYLEMAMSIGVPGLLVFLAFLFTIVKSGFSAVKRIDGEEEIYLYGLLAAILAYLIKVFFNISVVTVAPFFWALLGLMYALAIHIIKNQQPTG